MPLSSDSMGPDTPPPIFGAQALPLGALQPTQPIDPFAPAGALPVSGSARRPETRATAIRGNKALAIGVQGHTVELSVPWQNLLGDEFIANAPRIELEGRTVPTLGGIPLFNKLGQGGMGAVYYGIHRGLHREVAVKVLPFHLAEMKPELIKRFFREARIASKISSDRLVRVTDVAQEGKLSYLVMEYVTGKSAWALLRDMRLKGEAGYTEIAALDICIAACKGLKAAHDANIIHRDIKPDNILVPQNKTSGAFEYELSKLADLGLARQDEGAHSMTNSDACLGTPGFMAPEQVVDARQGGKPADVFGMGATLYALLCSEPPFTGTTAMQSMWSTIDAEHTPLRSRRKDVSKTTAEVVNICLAKNSAHRYADAGALLKALEASRKALKDPQSVNFAEVIRPRIDADDERRKRAAAAKALEIDQRIERPVSFSPLLRKLVVGLAIMLVVVGCWALYGIAAHNYILHKVTEPRPSPDTLDASELTPLPEYDKKLADTDKAGVDAKKNRESQRRKEDADVIRSASESASKR